MSDNMYENMLEEISEKSMSVHMLVITSECMSDYMSPDTSVFDFILQYISSKCRIFYVMLSVAWSK